MGDSDASRTINAEHRKLAETGFLPTPHYIGSKEERVAANGRPLGRAGDLAEVRERFAEHPSGLFAVGPRECLSSIRFSDPML